jgi:DNA-binding transcriptional MerR regulator
VSDKYRIHEFATRAGVSVRTLHHYDHVGLLEPRRTSTGYRLYSSEDLERLERILALKTLGFPLKRIKTLLALDPPSLAAVLRRQAQVLEDGRRRLDRAIRVLRHAERRALVGGPVFHELVEAIEMDEQQDAVNAMRKYFDDASWEHARSHYQQWPSRGWQELYRDVEAALHLDPGSDAAQALARRWMLRFDAEAEGRTAVRAGMWRAWLDRRRWPREMQLKLEGFDIERIERFIGEASWARWRIEQADGADRAPDRVGATKLRLFREIQASLSEDPGGTHGQRLAARWNALLDQEVGGDESARETLRRFWENREHWPTGYRAYVASLYETDWEMWNQVAGFVERARAAAQGRAV